MKILALLALCLILLPLGYAAADHGNDKHTAQAACSDDECVVFLSAYYEEGSGAAKFFLIKFRIENNTRSDYTVQWDFIDRSFRADNNFRLIPLMIFLQAGGSREFSVESLEKPELAGTQAYVYEKLAQELLKARKDWAGIIATEEGFFVGNPVSVAGFIPKNWLRP